MEPGCFAWAIVKNTFRAITLLEFEVRTSPSDQDDQPNMTNLMAISRATPEKNGCDVDGTRSVIWPLCYSILAPSQVSRNPCMMDPKPWIRIQTSTLHYKPGFETCLGEGVQSPPGAIMDCRRTGRASVCNAFRCSEPSGVLPVPSARSCGAPMVLATDLGTKVPRPSILWGGRRAPCPCP